jgi:hypothetical protein
LATAACSDTATAIAIKLPASGPQPLIERAPRSLTGASGIRTVVWSPLLGPVPASDAVDIVVPLSSPDRSSVSIYHSDISFRGAAHLHVTGLTAQTATRPGRTREAWVIVGRT